jgi:MoaA/NifB/PqqE/SkfB family radical SAM enzyme
MDERLKRIKSWVNGNKESPYTIDLMPTNKCNLSCLACHQRSINDKSYYVNELSTKKYKEIIEEASELKVRNINILGGGEPFLRKDIIEIMQSVKQNNLRGYVVTNATLLDKQKIKDIVSMGWDALAISLDAPDAKTHDYLRQKKGCFKKITRAIKQINSEKKRQNKDKPEISINFLLTNINHNKILKLVKLCNKFNINEIQLMNMLICSDLGNDLIINKEQKLGLEFELKKSLALAEKYNIKNNIKDIGSFIDNSDLTNKNYNHKKIGENINCLEPFWHIVISATGYVVCCNMSLDNCTFPRTDYVENINENNLKDIWYGKKFNEFRNLILDNKNNTDLCKTCCSTIIINSDKDTKELNFLKL